MTARLAIIIVTHDSQSVLPRCVAAIDGQSMGPERVVIVDSGSTDRAYLDPCKTKPGWYLEVEENIGFAAANNRGLERLSGAEDYVLFINPDTFLEPDCLARGVEALAAQPEAAALTGTLRGYDSDRGRATGLLDSTGVRRSWYGRWYDRGQGQPDDGRFMDEQFVPALCGAFMLCRTAAVENELPDLFDESFFLYKEDIDLCLRLRKRGWKLLYSPRVRAFHARGWASERRRVDRRLRLLASRSEIRLTSKHRSPYLIWALAKYGAVLLFDF